MRLNQPRNRYGLRVHRNGQEPRVFWYPNHTTREDARRGFVTTPGVLLTENVGAEAR